MRYVRVYRTGNLNEVVGKVRIRRVRDGMLRLVEEDGTRTYIPLAVVTRIVTNRKVQP